MDWLKSQSILVNECGKYGISTIELNFSRSWKIYAVKYFYIEGEEFMKKFTRLFYMLIIIALLIGACNMPSGNQVQQASETSAAQTVEALLSATPVPAAVTPSFTPLPATLTPIPQPINTNTPVATATSNCNVAQFITDVTIPDGTIMTPGQAFIKKWRIKNIGSCAWSGFSLVFDSGDSMGAPATKAISDLAPGQEVDLEVALTAPSSAGSYRGYFRINTNGGVLVPVVNGHLGKSFYVDIKVQLPAPAVFSVTSVTYVLGTWNDATHTNCPRVTANITTSAAGTVTYTWKTSSGTNPSQTLAFASAGTQSINYDWALGSVWNGTPSFVGIYVNSPDNQDFGKIDFTTACTVP
jgi:hypothetical protein